MRTFFFFFVDLIQPICLPILSLIRDRNLVKSRPYVAGWGTVGFGKYFIGNYIFYSIIIAFNKYKYFLRKKFKTFV